MRYLLLLSIAAGAVLPSAAHAYDRDVHYLWTWYLALHSGYTERQAYQVASAAVAVDQDPDTRPLSSTAWTLWRGDEVAPYDGQVATAWRDFHCFADRKLAGEPGKQDRQEAHAPMIEIGPDGPRAVGDLDEAFDSGGPQGDPLAGLGWVAFAEGPAKKARFDRSDELWEQAKAEGNPGTLIHYEQDCWAHREFTDERGHAFARNAPDWASADRERALEMTRATLDILGSFRRYALDGERVEPDLDRIAEVLDQLLEANSLDTTGLVRPEGRFNPYTEFWPQHLEGLDRAEVEAQWEELQAKFAETYATGRPEFAEAVAVLAAAVSEDKFYERIPAFPEEWWEPPPTAWLPLDLDDQGRARVIEAGQPRPPAAWAVEDVAVAPGEASVRVEGPDRDGLYTVHLELPYTLSGQAPLPALGEARVWETCTFGDEGTERLWRSVRGNGAHALEQVVHRPASALAEGATWSCTVEVHGLEPVTADTTVSAPGDAEELPATKVDGLQPHLAKLAALRVETRGLAGRVATACTAADTVADEASADLAGIVERASSVDADLATLEEALAALEAPAALRERVDGATASRGEVHGRLGELERLAGQLCERADRLDTAETTEELEASQPTAAHLKAFDQQFAAVDEGVATTAEHTGAAQDIVGRMESLEQDVRRIQDAAWRLDAEMRSVERALTGARRILGGVDEAAGHLAEQDEEAKGIREEAAATFAGLKGSGAQKKAMRAVTDLAEAIAGTAGSHAGCPAERAERLDALQEQVVDLGSRTADLTARQASAATDLPDARSLHALRLAAADARLAEEQALDAKERAAEIYARGTACHRTAEALWSTKAP